MAQSLVHRALELDEQNDPRAYVAYLRAICDISNTLIDADSNHKRPTQWLDMLNHCCDRARALAPLPAPADQACQVPPRPTNTDHQQHSAPSTPQTPQSAELVAAVPESPSQAMFMQQRPTVGGLPSEKRFLKPLERAHLQNALLERQCMLQMQGVSERRASALRLQLARNKASNLAFAKTQEERLNTKLLLRQQRLAEEARTSRTKAQALTGGLDESVSSLVTTVRSFDLQWGKEFLEKKNAILHDTNAAQKLVDLVLKNDLHPLAKKLLSAQALCVTLLQRLISNTTTTPIAVVTKTGTEEVHTNFESLYSMISNCYEELDSNENRDEARLALQQLFLPPLTPFLLELYAVLNLEKDRNLIDIAITRSGAHPRELAVAETFWLEGRCVTPDANDGHEHSSEEIQKQDPPYAAAIALLRDLPTCTTPIRKVDQLVKVTRAICRAVSDYWHPTEIAVGGDDLVPIMSLVILRARLPRFHAECHYMADFVDEVFMLGEEGYCLTTAQLAADHLLSVLAAKERELAK